MELLLNLFWLTVALLTVGLWWRDARAAGSPRRGRRLSQLVVLSCGLVLLFPVVSVTDDLHPLRPEMEESNRSKKIKGTADNSSQHAGVFGPVPAQVVACFSFAPRNRTCGQVLTQLTPVPKSADVRAGACRAPPALG
jgi:hypothetical protein